MKSILTFMLVLFAIALQSISAQAMGPIREAGPESKKIEGLQQDCADAMRELNQCKNDGKDLKEKKLCESSASPGQGGTGTSINGQIKGAGRVEEGARDIASGVNKSCQGGIDKCTESCRTAAEKAQQSCGTNKSTEREKQQAKDKGKAAAEKMGEYCRSEGQPRADAAKKQADANNQSKNEADKKDGQSSGGQGGGMPQMPQPPPKEEAKKDKDENKNKCTAENAGTAECAASVACTQPGGAMSAACQIGTPITGGVVPPVTKEIVLKASEAEDSRMPASVDITPP